MDQTDRNGLHDDLELNMVEIGIEEDSTNKQGRNNHTPMLVIAGIAIVVVIAMISYLYFSRELTFKSVDGTVSIKTPYNWAERKIAMMNNIKDVFSVTNMTIYKKGTRMYPDQINIMRVVDDISGLSPEELYSTWKDNYEFNSLLMNMELDTDSSGNPIPASAQRIIISDYEAQQVEYDEKTNLNVKVSHFTTIVRTGTNCFIIDGICKRENRNSFLKEYNRIVKTLKPVS